VIVLRFRIYVSFIILCASKILKKSRCVAISYKSQIDLQIKKIPNSGSSECEQIRQTIRVAVRAGFRFYSSPEVDAGKNLTPDSMTHAPESGVEFMTPISGAGFWSVCREF